MPDFPSVPIICGPTGSGKTDVSLRLAESFPIEVVSADSRQIIRHLNIGTAKPTADERAKVRCHLIDIIEPGERYSAFRFIEDASRSIGDILSRANIPVVVGGTGLYLRALTHGVVEIESDDMKYREQLERELAELGADPLWQRLNDIDPLEAAKVHPNNHVRLIRALEIYYLTGKTKSDLVSTGAYKKPEYRFRYFCLAPERQLLYSRINQRVDAMIQAGLVAEVKDLVDEGLAGNVRKANVIGYSEILDYLQGRRTLPEAIAQIKQNHRRYAKRQMTWFRGQEGMEFYQEPAQLLRALEEWLTSVYGSREKS